jgi:hypothetical protein
MKRKKPWILFMVFLACLIFGLSVGEYRSVLEKAVTVCLSCIGLG